MKWGVRIYYYTFSRTIDVSTKKFTNEILLLSSSSFPPPSSHNKQRLSMTSSRCRHTVSRLRYGEDHYRYEIIRSWRKVRIINKQVNNENNFLRQIYPTCYVCLCVHARIIQYRNRKFAS